MFRIGAVTPPFVGEDGGMRAVGLLRIGPRPIHFVIDLSYWSIADYQRQWQQALRQMMHGAPRTALLTAYRGPQADSHVMWVLWRESGYVHVQEQTIVAGELDAPFDPADIAQHLHARVPASENALPIREWRIDSSSVFAAALGIRWPFR